MFQALGPERRNYKLPNNSTQFQGAVKTLRAVKRPTASFFFFFVIDAHLFRHCCLYHLHLNILYKQGGYHGSLHYVFRAKLPTMPRDKNKLIAKTDTTITHKHPPKKEKNRKERRLESYLTLKIIFVEENIQKETISMTSFFSSMYK